MGLLVHTLAGHSRALFRESGSDVSNRGSGDFASLVDDRSGQPPRSTGSSGGASGGNRGGGDVGSIEPHRLTDAQLALLGGDGDGGSDDANPGPTNDTDLPPPGTEPGARDGGVKPPRDDAAGGEDPGSTGTTAGSSGASPGVTTGLVGDIEPYVDPQSSQDDTGAEERAITAMRDAGTRFESMSALLQLTQGI